MTIKNIIGDVKFFEGKITDERSTQTTLNNINSLLDKNLLTKEMVEKLKQMFLSGEVNFGSDGLTVEESENFNLNSYANIIYQYNALQSKLNANKNIVINSIIGYWILILFLQKAHLPLKNK